jgi:arginine N-succinyltransferase
MTAAPLTVRAAAPRDLDALLKLSRAAGQGMTNLPPCREGLARKLCESAEAIASPAPPAAAMLLLALDQEGEMRGSSALFPKLGVDWPFYSFRISAMRQTSRALGKTVTGDRLVLVNDYDGYSEVGGLVIDPALRGKQAGRLIARSRYLFLAEHRGWFGKRVLSELRGWHEADGRSPVWEALGRPFYEMDFAEADRLGVGEGKQMIADLGPKHPIYLNLLPPDARAAIGKAHKDGRAAEKLLLDEGFRFEGCVDIFDGGPTMVADVEALKGVRESRKGQVIAVGDRKGGVDSLVSIGRGAAFRAARGMVTALGSGVRVSQSLMDALDLKPGDEVRHVPF